MDTLRKREILSTSPTAGMRVPKNMEKPLWSLDWAYEQDFFNPREVDCLGSHIFLVTDDTTLARVILKEGIDPSGLEALEVAMGDGLVPEQVRGLFGDENTRILVIEDINGSKVWLRKDEMIG